MASITASKKLPLRAGIFMIPMANRDVSLFKSDHSFDIRPPRLEFLPVGENLQVDSAWRTHFPQTVWCVRSGISSRGFPGAKTSAEHQSTWIVYHPQAYTSRAAKIDVLTHTTRSRIFICGGREATVVTVKFTGPFSHRSFFYWPLGNPYSELLRNTSKSNRASGCSLF